MGLFCKLFIFGRFHFPIPFFLSISFSAYLTIYLLLYVYQSNNVPGTEVSLGTDTALNSIVEAADRLVQSAGSSRS